MNSLIAVCGKGIRVQGRLIRTAKVEGDKFVFLEDPEAVLAGLRGCGIRVDLFTFIQRLPDTSPKYSYPMEWDNFAALPVTTFDDWWTHQIGFKARNKAKQASKKGVVIREVPFDETLVRGIQEVYNESPVRQGTRNSHYGKDFQTVYREEATFLDSSVFIGAFLGEELIGFIKLLWDETRTQAGLLNIVSMVRHRDKAPTNALVAQAVRSCAERGISYLVYSNFAYGKREQNSLADFKERNGFVRTEVPRYYVPMTNVGKVAYQLGLHRELADHVPAPVAAKLRELRSAWYNRKFQSATEVS
jgi:hypothetical protein